ncbi:MAG: protoporphyrinogen oxidase [Acidobacteriaceae bacterium]|nr:protoporphyrinogen oxidase [Acidobacteriaceae bacterium]
MANDGVIIVGGGVSGLATANFLATRGVASTLFEKNDRLGGLIKTDLVEGCRLEAGPDSFLSAKPAVTEIAGMLGLADHIIGSNDKARRVYVVRDGKLVAMPKGMVMMVPAQWGPVFHSRLFSTGTKARLLAEIFEKPTIRSEDVSVGQFVEEHFGKEILEYIAEPLLCGVYGGDSASLSAESVLPRFLSYEARYGSLIKGVREESAKTPRSGPLFSSFRNGMGELIDALASGSRSYCKIVHSAVTNLEQTTAGWRVAADGKTLEGAALVLACPSYITGELLANISPVLASHLSSIPYSSAILVTLVLRASEIKGKLDGFGFLVPRAERRSIAAATFIHNKFPGRIPPELAGIRAFIVGKEAKELLNAPESELLNLVREELRRLTGVQGQPVFSSVYRWPDSMPQYVVGHKERQRAIADCLEHFASLYLVGNSYDGIGIPDCVHLARQAADRLSRE